MADQTAARVQELVAARLARGNDDASYNAFMTACGELRANAPAAIAAAREVFTRGSADERDAVADLVCRVDFESTPDVHDAIYQCLGEFLGTETAGEANSSVIAAIIRAFGHLYDERAVPALLHFASHSSEEVRFAVASSLPSTTNYEVNERTLGVVDVLVGLSSDEDSDVRDWATFGLGQLEVDTPAVRDALVARMNDSDEDTRSEAFMALAQLRDERVVDPLLAELAKPAVGRIDVEAAGEFADARFLPRLLEIAEWWEDEDGDRAILDDAIRNCSPPRSGDL